MIDEKIILQVLAEQQEEVKNYKPQRWVNRKEESLFEFDTNMAQVVIGVRRSGKSTLVLGAPLTPQPRVIHRGN